MSNKTQERYFDYILMYANTVLELWEQLEKRCQKSRWWDFVFDRKTYMFFATTKWVTLVDKKSTLELTFSFLKVDNKVYFEKAYLHNFIESDLNVSGLWKDFPTNSTTRSSLFDECLTHFIHAWRVQKKDDWFTILKEEIF